MIRTILFDFDGTLNDTWRLYLEAFRRTLAAHYGRLLTDAEILALQPSAERRLFARILDQARHAATYAEFLSHYEALHPELNDGLYAGILEMLAELRGLGVRLGVVTGKSRPAWDVTFPSCGLDPFDVVITDDDVVDPKPAPEGLLAAIQRIDALPESTLYVGDTVLDGAAAQAASVGFGAALWSKSAAERAEFTRVLSELKPAAVFVQPGDVVKLVRSLRQVARRTDES
ncbi:MAG TPA: HAD-IA family hydrolase [Nitrospirales bacterium]|nr:HAD-IA family hydrolase [Nitrospirales bacterium]